MLEMPPPSPHWQRVSIWSPVVRLGHVPVLASLYLLDSQRGSKLPNLVLLVLTAVLSAGLGFLSWWVTRWRISGSDLQIERGIIRRQSLRIPLARIQAVDVVAPLVARFFGIAEVRVVSGGGGSEKSRLAYLHTDYAQQVRAQLLALAHGLAATVAEPPQYPLYEINNARFVLGTLTRRTPLAALLVLVATAIALSGVSGGAVISVSLLLLCIPVTGMIVFQVLNADWGFRLSQAGDGFHLDRGLLQTRHETIPFNRVQGIRVIQPWIWRHLGWYAIAVDVARQKVSRRTDPEAQGLARWLVPIADAAQVAWVISRACPGANVSPPPGSRVPKRAIWAIPLSYRFAACWFDENYVYTRSGRMSTITTVVPHHKVQSVRSYRGPALRVLGLTDVFVDTAGTRWSARGLARDAAQADILTVQFATLAEHKRAQVTASRG